MAPTHKSVALLPLESCAGSSAGRESDMPSKLFRKCRPIARNDCRHLSIIVRIIATRRSLDGVFIIALTNSIL
jgi:hypothetical protein